MLPQPWSSPPPPLTCARRPNSLIVTTVTRLPRSDTSFRNAASADAKPFSIDCMSPHWRLPMPVCMSQLP